VTAAAWRSLGLPFDRRLLALAGALAVLALGLPWQRVPLSPGISYPGAVYVFPDVNTSTPDIGIIPPIYIPTVGGYTIPGTGHAMRLTALAAALLLWFAVRRGLRRIAWLALAVAAIALPLGVNHGAVMPGRIAYLAALVAAALALGLLRLPRRLAAGRRTPG
jgi:hypothetical protein